jgi:arginine exporter protein ArgO
VVRSATSTSSCCSRVEGPPDPAAGLSTLSLIADPLPFLLPIARFGGMLWLVAYGFLLPRTRHQVSDAAAEATGDRR